MQWAPPKVLASNTSKHKHEALRIRQHGHRGQGTVTATHPSNSCPSCPVRTYSTQGVAVEALNHLHFWVTEQPPGISTQDWAQQMDVTALTSHCISPRGVRAQAAFRSQRGGASREVPSSSITLASSFLLHALACVSKNAYWDIEITLYCQKPTKWRLPSVEAATSLRHGHSSKGDRFLAQKRAAGWLC